MKAAYLSGLFASSCPQPAVNHDAKWRLESQHAAAP